MRNELECVARRIQEILCADEFPAAVRPAYLAAAVRDYPTRGGKRLRPALLLWSCGLLGGKVEAAGYAAAAIEVTHNWTLVHDDIIDRDELRRGEITTHCQLAQLAADEFGLAPEEAERAGRDRAILCGDLQQAWANALLLKSAAAGAEPARVLDLAVRLQHHAVRAVVSGEALDMEFALRDLEVIDPAEVLAMYELKTGALLRFAAEAGGVLAGGTAAEIARLGDFALRCGVAFQLRDDCLGIFGETAELGKNVGGDLRERKPTVLLLEALRRAAPADRDRLLDYLGRPRYLAADLAAVRRLMTDCGAFAAVEAQARALAAEAAAILAEFPDNAYRSLLRAFATALTERRS